MPRKLKTFTTSLGFFDLAVAAPSMKAALEAWGLHRNAFHEGTAQETTDRNIIAATMAQPGVVLRRAVGSKAKFEVDAAPPKSLPAGVKPPAPAPKAKRRPKPVARSRSGKAAASKAASAKIIQFEAEKVRREKAREQERQKQEIDARRDEERRAQAAAKAEAKLERGRKAHEAKLRKLEKALAAAQDRVDAERKRWKAEAEKIETEIHSAEA